MKTSTRWVILIIVLLVVIAGGIFVWQKYFSKTVQSPRGGSEKDQVVIGMGQLVSALYPETQADFYDINYNLHIFETLATFDRESQIVPMLATHWDNPDDLTWRFYLSPKATFSNGDPVTADDVKFTVDYLMSNKLPLSEYLPEIAEVKAVDSKIVEFKTSSTNPIFLNRIAISLLILSKKEIEANGIKNYIGSGPYRLANSDEEEVVFTSNENYWQEKPKIKKAVFKLYSGEEAKINALLNKEIDITKYGFTNEAVTAQLEEAIKNKEFQKEQTLDPTVMMIALDTVRDKTPNINLEKNPLNDKRVRQAIYQAINAKEIVNKVPAKGNESSQIVAPSTFGYNPNIKRLSYDVLSAKKLMDEAGLGNGFDLTLDYPDSPGVKDYYEPLISQLQAINIRVTLNPIPQEQYLQKRETPAVISSWSADTMDAAEILELLIHTPTEELGAFNIGYSNSSVDQLIEDSGKTLDQRARQTKLQEALRVSMEDIAIVPLFQSNVKYAFSNSIVWKPRVDGAYRVWEMAGKED